MGVDCSEPQWAHEPCWPFAEHEGYIMSELILFLGAFIYGGLYVLFAFREPPAVLERFFPVRVPLLFGLVLIMLPDRLAMRVGRLGLGALFLFGSSMIFSRAILS